MKVKEFILIHQKAMKRSKWHTKVDGNRARSQASEDKTTLERGNIMAIGKMGNATEKE